VKWLSSLLAPFQNYANSVEIARLRADLAQLRLEWAETLDKLSAWAKRQSKRERDELDRQLPPALPEQSPKLVPEASGGPVDKAALRRKVAQMRGITGVAP